MNKETRSMIMKLNDSFKKAAGQDVLFIGENQERVLNRISSGSIALDFALGGGMPQGRVVELFGNEGSGKSTIALMTVAEAQRQYPDKVALYIDVERSLDLSLAASYGVDVDSLVIARPVSGENALDILEAGIVSKFVSIAVVDSVAALVPTQEQQADMASQQMGLQARMIGKCLRKITTPAADADCLVIFINQIREKVGVMYGNPETTPGGRALKFYSSVRIRVSTGEPIKEKDNQIGHVVNTKCVKNKTAQPQRVASFKLIYGQGVDKIAEAAEMAVEVGIIKRAGAWYSLVNEETGEIMTRQKGEETVTMKWQGKPAIAEYLRTDLELYQEILGRLEENAPELEPEAE